MSISREEQQAAPRVLVDTYGSSEIEPAATLATDPNNVVNYEGPPNPENLCAEACPRCKELEDAIKQSTAFTSADQQFSEQAKLVELETKIEKLKLEIQSKSTENSNLHIRIKELKSEKEACLIHNNQEEKSFDVQFQLPFEDLRAHMTSSLSKNNAVSKVSFSAKVDVVNRKLTDIQIGQQWDSINDDSDRY